MFGFNRIGRLKGGKGVYVHDFAAMDPKVNFIVMKMALPFLSLTIQTWYDTFSDYLDKNMDQIKRELSEL